MLVVEHFLSKYLSSSSVVGKKYWIQERPKLRCYFKAVANHDLWSTAVE